MRIYLAGSVPKGDKDEKNFYNWREKYQRVLSDIFDDAEFINPYNPNVDERDSFAVVGTDCKTIKESNLIVANAGGKDKLGAGTSMEYVIAKYFSRPLVSVLSKNSYNRRPNMVFHGKRIEDWIHPFILTFSDFVVEDVEEIRGLKEKILACNPKDISIIDDSINYTFR